LSAAGWLIVALSIIVAGLFVAAFFEKRRAARSARRAGVEPDRPWPRHPEAP
jgi:uncharacterized membrane protein YedE/YeeE